MSAPPLDPEEALQHWTTALLFDDAELIEAYARPSVSVGATRALPDALWPSQTITTSFVPRLDPNALVPVVPDVKVLNVFWTSVGLGVLFSRSV